MKDGPPFASGAAASTGRDWLEPATIPPPRPPAAMLRTRRFRTIGLATLAVLVLVGGGIAGLALRSHRLPSLTVHAPRLGLPGGSGPAESAYIDDAAIATDPRAEAVVRLLAGYFGAINDHDAQSAAQSFDPAGSFDPADPVQLQRFAAQTATSYDDQIVILDLRAYPTVPGALLVGLSFRSQQSADIGPAGEPCTLWRLHYVLSQYGVGYRILRSAGKATAPC